MPRAGRPGLRQRHRHGDAERAAAGRARQRQRCAGQLLHPSRKRDDPARLARRRVQGGAVRHSAGDRCGGDLADHHRHLHQRQQCGDGGECDRHPRRRLRERGWHPPRHHGGDRGRDHVAGAVQQHDRGRNGRRPDLPRRQRDPAVLSAQLYLLGDDDRRAGAGDDPGQCRCELLHIGLASRCRTDGPISRARKALRQRTDRPGRRGIHRRQRHAAGSMLAAVGCRGEENLCGDQGRSAEGSGRWRKAPM